MTSASELFTNRRSRLGRSDPDIGSDPSLNLTFHRHRGHHHRYDSDGCHPLRWSSHASNFCRGVSPSELASARLDQDRSHVVNRNNVNTESRSGTARPSSTGNERLPGAVLLARARLLERLSGVSISRNRQSNRASSSIHQRVSALSNVARLVDPADLIPRTERFQISQEHNKKLGGLSQESLNKLHKEVFRHTEIGNDTRDCSICLEGFMDGEVLLCLPCSHRFHSFCLDPWLRTCGRCPCCRRAVLFSGDNLKNDQIFC